MTATARRHDRAGPLPCAVRDPGPPIRLAAYRRRPHQRLPERRCRRRNHAERRWSHLGREGRRRDVLLGHQDDPRGRSANAPPGRHRNARRVERPESLAGGQASAVGRAGTGVHPSRRRGPSVRPPEAGQGRLRPGRIRRPRDPVGTPGRGASRSRSDPQEHPGRRRHRQRQDHAGQRSAARGRPDPRSRLPGRGQPRTAMFPPRTRSRSWSSPPSTPGNARYWTPCASAQTGSS